VDRGPHLGQRTWRRVEKAGHMIAIDTPVRFLTFSLASKGPSTHGTEGVGAVVCVHAKGMKEPWCLATSQREATAATLVNHYAKRWTIEPQFRDTKDLQFGMGLSSTRIGEPMHRDRLLLISAFAITLLTPLGVVGESLGMDRLLKSNTSKTRTHSLFRQGCMLYDLIPNRPEHRLLQLMQKFNHAPSNAAVLTPVFALAK
jgi:hypothetical protein